MCDSAEYVDRMADCMTAPVRLVFAPAMKRTTIAPSRVDRAWFFAEGSHDYQSQLLIPSPQAAQQYQ